MPIWEGRKATRGLKGEWRSHEALPRVALTDQIGVIKIHKPPISNRGVEKSKNSDFETPKPLGE